MRQMIARRLRRAAGDERGVALIVVALGLTAFLGVASLALDLGMLYTARTESQRVADGAALAGAAILVNEPTNEAGARDEAKEYAAMNNVRGSPVTLQDPDIEVFLDIRKVRVTVRHIEGGVNGAIATLFGRILGRDLADVVTVAAAQVYPSLGLECILPLSLPDQWCEAGWVDNGDGTFTCGQWPGYETPDHYEPDADDWYEAWDPDNPGAFTGYSEASVGQLIRIKPGHPGDATHPGWFFPFRIPGTQGGADYRESICSCQGEGIEWGDELVVETEPGNMIGPTKQGFSCLIDKDPSAIWDDQKKCVTHGGGCEWSDRIRPMVLFDPGDKPDPGKKPFNVSNYVGVFVESIEGNDIWVRFVKYMGVNPSDEDVTVPGPVVQTIRLVE